MDRVGREEGGVVGFLAEHEADEALLGELELAAVVERDLARDLGLDLAALLVLVSGRAQTEPPPWGPMIFGHQRYLANESAILAVIAIEAEPHR